MTNRKSTGSTQPGPKADRVKIDGDWEGAVGKALKKPRPAGGWPDEKSKKKPKESK